MRQEFLGVARGAKKTFTQQHGEHPVDSPVFLAVGCRVEYFEFVVYAAVKLLRRAVLPSIRLQRECAACGSSHGSSHSAHVTQLLALELQHCKHHPLTYNSM